MAAKKKMGRPEIEYDPEIAEAICVLFESSVLSLEQVRDKLAKNFPNMPSVSVLNKWKRENPKFKEQYLIARNSQGHHLADKAVQESHTPRMVTVTRSEPRGTVTITSDSTERSKLIIQAYFKRAGQLAPKELGERMAHTGDDGGAIQFVVTRSGKKEQ